MTFNVEYGHGHRTIPKQDQKWEPLTIPKLDTNMSGVRMCPVFGCSLFCHFISHEPNVLYDQFIPRKQ